MRRGSRRGDARRARVGCAFVPSFPGAGHSLAEAAHPGQPGRAPAVEPLEGRVLMAAADLDPAFGAGGKVLTSFPGSCDDEPAAVAVSGGKTVVAGSSSPRGGASDFALARYNADGTLDTSFGAGGAEGSGLVITDFLGRNDLASAVSVLSSGKILVAGTSGGDLSLARYNSNGTLDTSFGVGGSEGSGKVLTNLGATESAAALAVLPDGKFLVAGSRGSDFLLVRYNASGTLDTSFGGGDGWATANFGGAEVGKSIALLSSGKIVVGGNADRDYDLARFTAGGSVDTTFGGGTGRVRTSIVTQPGDEFHTAGLASVLPVGGDQVLAVGLTYFLRDDAGNIVYSLVRYNADGTVNKRVNTNPALFASQPSVASAVRLSTGKVVVGARHADQSEILRYNTDLTLDATFGGGDGRIVPDRAIDALAASGDKVVATGEVVRTVLGRSSAGQVDFQVARYNADGSLDSTFARGGGDGDGVAATNFADTAAAASRANGFGVTLGPDGKVVVAGTVNGGPALLRYNPDGTPDVSFGNNGAVTDPNFTGDFHFRPVVQPDSKILVSEFDRMWRYNADGTLDRSFGVGGADGDGVITPADYGIVDLAVLGDGKIVVAGVRFTGPGQPTYDFLLTRLNPDGTVDSGFGDGGTGRTIIDFGGTADFPAGMALAPDGKIVLAGFAENLDGGSGDANLALARFNANGTLDTSFNPGGPHGDGRVRATFATQGTDVAVLPDGRVLVLGVAGPFDNRMAAVARYTTAGALDPSFAPGGADGDGVLVTDFGLGRRVDAGTVLLAADGKIFVAGSVGPFQPETSQDFFLARLTANGAPDTTFNAGSEVVTTDFGGGDRASGAVLAGDGSVLVAGTSEFPSGAPDGAPAEFAARIVLARYRGDVPAGAIRIDGTSGNDNIALTQSGSILTIVRNGVTSTRSLTGVNRLFVYGLDGDDTLSVAGSVLVGATLLGGRGNDSLRGGGGADQLYGGEGTDAADYANSTAGLSLSLDERANDGPSGLDNVHGDVEILLGGAGADTLTGGSSYNVLVGNGGDDTLQGSGGRDVLIGGQGRDRLLGDDGDDLLIDSRTTYDTRLPFLRTLSIEWRNTSRSYADRVARLRTGVLGVMIDSTNVPNDNVVDTLTGGTGRDWFVFHSGDLRADRAADETATQV